MTQPIDTVSVEVVPLDLDSFERKLTRSIDEAARVIESDLGKSFDKVARDADDAAGRIGREFQQGGDRAESALKDVASQSDQQFSRVEKDANSAADHIGSTFRRIATIVAGAFVINAVKNWAEFTLASLGNIDRLSAQTDAVLKSMNVNFTNRKEIEDYAKALEGTSGIEAELIQTGQNFLLTFGNIQNQIGAGNDIFNRATEAMLNMSVALGVDTQSAALQLGKALNDPVAGITALTRSGVSFSQQQKDLIKTMVESGDVLGAQRLILNELEREFSGSAEAFGATLPGQIARLKNEFGDLSEAIVSGVLPALRPLLDTLATTIKGLTPTLTPVLEGLTTLLIPVFQVIGTSLSKALESLTPVLGPLGEAIAAIAAAFAPLLPVIGQLVATVLPPLAKIITSIAEAVAPLIALVAQFVAQLLTKLAPVFEALAPIVEPIVEILGEALAGILPVLTELLLTVVDAVTPLVPLILQLVQAFLPLLDPILDLVQQLLPPLVQLITTLLDPIMKIITPILQMSTLIAEQLTDGALVPLVELIAKLVVPELEALVAVLDITLIPVLDAVSALLSGDFAEAWEMVSEPIKQLGAVISDVAEAIVGFFLKMNHEARSKLNEMLDFVRSIPGKVLDAVGSLGNLLFDAGRNVIQGLIDGIKSMIGKLGDQIGDVAGTIRRYLPFSPAEIGPLSGRGSPEISGQSIGQMIAGGIRSQKPLLERTTADFLSGLQGISGVAQAQGATSTTVTSPEAAARSALEAVLSNLVIQIFLGDTELTDIVDVRISERNRATSRQIKQRTGTVSGAR